MLAPPPIPSQVLLVNAARTIRLGHDVDTQDNESCLLPARSFDGGIKQAEVGSPVHAIVIGQLRLVGAVSAMGALLGDASFGAVPSVDRHSVPAVARSKDPFRLPEATARINGCQDAKRRRLSRRAILPVRQASTTQAN